MEIYEYLWIGLNSVLLFYGFIVFLYIKCCNTKKLYNISVISYHIIEYYYSYRAIMNLMAV